MNDLDHGELPEAKERRLEAVLAFLESQAGEAVNVRKNKQGVIVFEGLPDIGISVSKQGIIITNTQKPPIRVEIRSLGDSFASPRAEYRVLYYSRDQIQLGPNGEGRTRKFENRVTRNANRMQKYISRLK